MQTNIETSFPENLKVKQTYQVLWSYHWYRRTCPVPIVIMDLFYCQLPALLHITRCWLY